MRIFQEVEFSNFPKSFHLVVDGYALESLHNFTHVIWISECLELTSAVTQLGQIHHFHIFAFQAL